MTDAHLTIVRRSVLLWIGAGLVMTLLALAAGLNDPALVRIALAVSAAYAVLGLAFGVWAGRLIARSRRAR
jgi:membrane associated rhomboid family serine protease